MSDGEPYDVPLVEDILTALEDVPLSDYYALDDADIGALMDPEVDTPLRIGSITEGPGEHRVVNGWGTDLSESYEGDGENPHRYDVAEDEVCATVTLLAEPDAGETSTYTFQRTDDGLEVVDAFVNVLY